MSTRRGFTLIEMMVVLLILGIMAAMTLPRVLGGRSREFDLVTEQIADLLTMYAQRTAMSDTPVGIAYDADRHWLQLVRMERSDDAVSEGEWVPDGTIRPVKLPEWVETPLLYADEEPTNITDHPFAYEPGRPRRAVSISVWTDDYSASLHLAPHAIVPTAKGHGVEARFGREVVDLDDMGRAREEW